MKSCDPGAVFKDSKAANKRISDVDVIMTNTVMIERFIKYLKILALRLAMKLLQKSPRISTKI